MKRMLSLFLAAAAFAPLHVTAQVFWPDTDVRVLVPFAFQPDETIGGAHGTVWIGQLWAANDSSEDIWVPLCEWSNCPGFLKARSQRKIDFTDDFPRRGELIDGGALLYVPSRVADRVSFSSRVLEVTRRAQPTGFAVPVVRATEFFDAPVVLPGIPAGPGIRSSLRIYDPSGHEGGTFLVELIVGAGRSTIASLEVTLAAGTFFAGLPMSPAFAAVHDLENLVPGGVPDEVFHVKITPMSGSDKYWTFASVTDNETQHVLIITAD
jgi:hypothetical protein